MTTKRKTEGVWTWSGFARYALARNTSLYTRVATGYRPGGPNVILPNVRSQVGADRVTSYELGIKADFASGLASIEAAIFQMDWSDIQLSVSNGSGASYFDNAGKARTRGFEMGANIRPSTRVSVALNAADTDAKLRENAPSNVGSAGDRLPYVPKFSASVTPQYVFPIGGKWEGALAANMRTVADRRTGAENAANTVKLPSYTAFDLSLAASNDRWTVRIYGRNVTNSDGLLSGSISNSALGSRNYFLAVPLQPRTIGLAVDLRF